eukprot:TRINITY_DN12712_c0_g2_i14.p4 TRINITY_DN12712_c0_g2~~TRINITY_DN12712_c0_g2_i14.p4  ORF type:complete len:150 (-),score=20.89 TRINITY_DN12712_c0_g2_i14:541-990(-)
MSIIAVEDSTNVLKGIKLNKTPTFLAKIIIESDLYIIVQTKDYDILIYCIKIKRGEKLWELQMLLTDVEEFCLEDQIVSFDTINEGADDFYFALGLAKGDLQVKGFKRRGVKTAYDYPSIFSRKFKVFDENFKLYYPISCLQFFKDSPE